MSEPIAETYVSIVPLVDEAQFKAQTQQAVAAATEQVKAVVPVTVQSQLSQVRDAAFAEAAKAQQAAELASAKSLVGQGSVTEATVALKAYADAALLAAKADVELAIASGTQTETFAASTALLQKQIALTNEDTVVTNRNTAAHLENGRVPRGSLRRQLEEVARGQESPSSLFTGGNIAKLTLGTIAFEAAFTGLQHLREGLKVTGDEALTFEGKTRNAGAALLGGDLVEAIGIINEKAPTTTETLKALKASASSTAVDFRNLGTEGAQASAKLDRADATMKALGQSGTDAGKAIHDAAVETRDAASAALALADALETSASAANDVQAAISAAGSEAAAFGERTRGAGAVAAQQSRPGSSASFLDETDTEANRAAIAQARADTTRQQLEEAKREAAAAAQAEKNQQSVVEGRVERRRATVEANRRVRDVEKRLAEEEAQARRAAEAERKKAQADARDAAAERARALRDGLDVREANLQLALEEAQNTLTVADDKKALRALVAFEHEKSVNRALTLKERQAAHADEVRYRQQLKDVNRQQLADALGVREQNLRNAIEAAKLTDTKADDDRADASYLKFLRNQVARAKARGDALAAAQAEGELIAFQVSLKDKKTSGGGFGLDDLFKEATSQFETFGSNIGPRNGVLSPQDARAALGRDVVGRIQGQMLSEAEKQTSLLASIDRRLGVGGTGLSMREKRSLVSQAGNVGGWRAAQEAADNAYGAG